MFFAKIFVLFDHEDDEYEATQILSPCEGAFKDDKNYENVNLDFIQNQSGKL